MPSTIANRLISWATGVQLNDYGCSLKVFRAEVIKPLHLRGEMHRFLPALASEIGVRIVEVPVNHRAREHGKSKYGLSRTGRVMLDLLTVKFLLSYSTQPLQIFGTVGGLMGLVGVVLLGYARHAAPAAHRIEIMRPPAADAVRDPAAVQRRSSSSRSDCSRSCRCACTTSRRTGRST